ncbi:DUF3368 domain-containing protein [Clostridium thermarum]|nr:DUF3368 domain-containing protein [Clostridium thermarum]
MYKQLWGIELQGIVEEIRPILDKMIQKDIRISSSLYEDILNHQLLIAEYMFR